MDPSVGTILKLKCPTRMPVFVFHQLSKVNYFGLYKSVFYDKLSPPLM